MKCQKDDASGHRARGHRNRLLDKLDVYDGLKCPLYENHLAIHRRRKSGGYQRARRAVFSQPDFKRIAATRSAKIRT